MHARRSHLSQPVRVLSLVLGAWLSACSDEPFSSCDPGKDSCTPTQGGASGATGGAATAGTSGGALGGDAGSGASTAHYAGAGGEGGSGGAEDSGLGGVGGCDPSASPSQAECTVDQKYGVFVSPLGDDAGDGTREHPFATLAKALGQAKALKKRVYACATEGAFDESVVVDGTLDKSALFGGFDCDDWSYSSTQATEVQGTDPVALRATGLTSLAIEDFVFTARDATEPGASSFGAWIQDSAGVMLRRVTLNAGKGANGADGASVSSASAAPGQPGNAGTAACTVATTLNPGGPAVESLCDDVRSGSIGAKGGLGASEDGNAGDGGAGLPASNGSGAPGAGQTAAISTWNCGGGAGHAGALGTSPPTAVGGSGPGTLSATGFASPAGADGANGAPGQGGGGGGGALAPLNCGGRPLTGASGGGGGGGGCGGKGGGGGSGGGASFALVSIDSEVALESTKLTSASGGAGGKGAAGQPGGKGGATGPGGDGSLGSAAACDGGRGGQGGNGAAGGGGAGGPSAGIAFIGAAPQRLGGIDFKVPEKGAPAGLDGKGLSVGAGAVGATSESLEY